MLTSRLSNLRLLDKILGYSYRKAPYLFHFINMSTGATSTHIRVSVQNTGLWNILQDEDTSRRTGELLEKDLAVSSADSPRPKNTH